MNQSELIGVFSHEIRNPLTLINSSLQLLESDCPAVLNCTLWPQIRQDVRDLLRMLNDMSSLTKSSHITPDLIPMARLLSDIDASVRPMMEEKGIRFIVSVKPELSDVNLWGDLPKLKEAAINLLLNAMDAVSESDTNGEILLLAEYAGQNTDSAYAPLAAGEEGSWVLIHVRDNGPGIPSEYMDTLFEPFVTHKPHGTGLGLGIVRNIVTQHGGNITVDTCADAPESYTDFCLHLPLPDRSTGGTAL